MLENDSLVSIRNKSYFRILREAVQTVDVIVLGDSLSYTSVSPLEMWDRHGFTSYVCGQSGQRIQESYYMLKTAFLTQSPKLVVLESHTLFGGEHGLKGRMVGVKEAVNYYFPLIGNHDIWKTLITDQRYLEENYKGFSFRDEVQPYVNGKYMEKTDQEEAITELAEIYMGKIVDLCRKHGTKILLLSTPSPINYNYMRHNRLERYARENGIDYLDLNLIDLGMDWEEDSLDHGDHLNYYGAEKVTRYLGQYVASHYRLKDRRSNPAYASWNQETADYMIKRETLPGIAKTGQTDDGQKAG